MNLIIGLLLMVLNSIVMSTDYNVGSLTGFVCGAIVVVLEIYRRWVRWK